ncbi:MAG: MBL fold metallo-hydrolase, partial [Dysosmobacter sp.]|nr:MBL fold metallo-hydrolase [Dysosmobacter sp.]
MHNVRNITPDVLLIGGSDRRLSLFENVFPVPRGVSYNAYLVQDEKTVLLDTADSAVGAHFYENLEHALQGRPLDYVVVNHMEPDHCSTLGAVLRTYPAAKVVASAKAISMIGQFFDADVTDRCVAVKEGDSLSTGRHAFTFVMAPMVHWPEVMVSYE